MSINHKPWYKKWWGVILAILIWPFFLLWFIWSKSTKAKGFKIAASIGVILLALIIFGAMLSKTPTSTDVSNKQPVSLDSLNNQSATILVAATVRTEQQMSAGQADAAQSNPIGSNSAFEKWGKTVQSKTDSNTDTAYSQAVAIYTSHKMSVPSELAAWKKDNFATYGDISIWQFAEFNNLLSLSTTDESTATSAYKQYQSDLAKAISDIKQLSPSATVTQPTITNTAPTQTPTASIASLNAQAVPILTPVLTDFENQMSTGQADATQSNAGDVNSAFHTWETNEQGKQDVANGKEQIDAYNKADNAYYNAHQAAPTALDSWSSDAGNLPGDISTWANAEEMVAEDQVTGSSSLSSDQQTAASALQQYQSDLAKTKADLAQL